ncbi:hypothetical protein HMPREF3291_22520 [Bacillus sp. HMSC76G11]|nr:hypothetical protein HMPREF3291_22520 [Bacillus sp. HMSC76G11]
MVLKMILIVIALIIIGLIKEIRGLLRVADDGEFLISYNGTYIEYMNNYLGKRYDTPKEKELYIKLISEAPKAQRLLMDAGLVDYQPAFRGYMVKNYAILLNTVQSLRNPSSLTEEFNWVHTILLMQIARYKELHADIKRNILNPIILLREGVQLFVTLPISLLYWTGIIQYSTQYKLSNNIVVKFLNFLIIIFGFVSAIFTIALGWEQFKELLKNFL